ncbi:isoprenylcysteine carboxylmethyltransferase family protein [Microlunatus sp. Gsoil 973]|uniref:methyltransferase family protein n=1 Tax=Microlunatus sp. Gsoil 973 TaxID=2672569 RepID=UPI001E2FBE74|nr:isoprenylcysteine carboxylmethyltransferase family protein [Microlunatus sp. Gsoil 973]
MSVALFAIGELQQAVRTRGGASRSRFGDEAAFRAIFFAGILVLPSCLRFLPQADIGGAAIFVIGAVVGWLGLLLRWWAFVALGRYFTTVVQVSADQPIIDRGPYRFVRHPGYSGLIVAFLGCGLMLGNWAAAVISAALIAAGLIVRLLREERALVAMRGSAYRDYAKGRARLLPFIW